jgi:diguanylate cyclase (GGDEF)-like protein
MTRFDKNPVFSCTATCLTTDELLSENSYLRAQLQKAQQKVTIEHQAFIQLQQQTQVDFLTKAYTRAVLEDRAVQAFRLARREATEVAVLLLDIDKFKQVNDCYGHAVGDQLLTGITLRMKQCLRATDTICRYGGDEFVVLLPTKSGSAEASQLGNKLLQSVCLPMTLEHHLIYPKVSIGIAIYPRHGDLLADLIEKADQAMYDAKRAGGNRIQLAY